MNEPKPFASLSSGLLARKGAARPAMRPQGMGQFSAGLDDLGWNDMGGAIAEAQVDLDAPYDDRAPSPIAALTPMTAGTEEDEGYEAAPPIVEMQRAAIEASFSAPADEQPVLATKLRGAAAEVVDPVEEVELDTAFEMQSEPVADEQPAPEMETVEVTAAVPVAPPAPANTRPKAAFTLRLDTDRHLKLRLACAMSGQSAQQLVTEALDQLLHSRPEVAALAGHVPGQAGK